MGAHILLYSQDPEADRAFFRDVLEFPHVNVGHGWLIFALPPAEVAVHPVEPEGTTQKSGMLDGHLYLMCSDLKAVVKSLEEKKVKCTAVEQAPWGIKTTIQLPSGGEVGLYQPRHETALGLEKKKA